MQKEKVIVICGPTASGKTALSIELAKKINGEIVSCDSMQIYKEMNIGTAKPTKEEMQGIKHYLIDFVSPDERYSVADYKKDAKKAIKEILAKGKTPIIVGGTGLYVDSLIYEIEYQEIEFDENYRKELEKRIFDEKVQLVFSVMYENDRGNELINEFAEYCCYEMIVNSVMPEEETIRILEKLFFSNNNEMISFALSHIYLVYGIKTKNRHTIMHLALEFMKKRSFILPVFKEYENEFSNDLYIEKNCTFIYFAPSDKSVLFYFREKGEFDFYSKAMRYLDFGIYYINIPVFFGEEIEYYICENKEKGSIETQKQIVANNNMNLHPELSDDPFFEINNAIIYENVYRYEEAENIINKKIRKNNKLRCKLL